MNRRAYLAVFSAACLAGLSGLFVKHMSIPPSTMAWIRTAVPTLLLGTVFLFQQRRIFRQKYRHMLLASVLNCGRMFFFFTAFVLTSISNATLILFTWPIFVTLLSAIFLKEVISRRQIGLLALAMLGIFIVYAQDLNFSGSDFLGMTAALLTAFFYSTTVVIFKSAQDHYGPFEMIFFQNLIGSLVFLPFFIYNEPRPQALDWSLAISHATLLGTLAFSFFFYGLKRMKASSAAMIAYIEIVVAMLAGTLIMKEPVTWQMILGGVVIVFATFSLRSTK